MEEQIYFEDLEFYLLEMEKILMTNKLANFVFAQPINWDIFQMKKTQNHKILKTTQVVRDNKENIWLIKCKK